MDIQKVQKNLEKKLGVTVTKAVAVKIRKLNQLTWACRATVLVASSTSVWANWLHSGNNKWAVIINIMPPVIVLFGYELTSRIPAWEDPNPKWWHVRRYLRPAAMVAITGIGAWLSYWHQNDAFYKYSGDVQTANLLPLAIDGLMVLSSVAVLDISDKIERMVSYAEAQTISTYKKDKEEKGPLPAKPKEKAPSKKELIVDYLKRYPEMPVPDVAKATSATMNYVYAIKDELRKIEQPDMEPAMA